MRGTVYLVGAGPGDPELLTLKAFKVMQRAQAVVYDRLVSDEIMALVPAGVPRFFAGKSCKQKAMTQGEINELLVALAKKYTHVLRLKGGDPLLFGRGGEEALHLVKHGISFEIIPGVTSAQGCGAYAGIPLTHRGLATGVRFITGHRVTAEDTEDPLDLNWQSLADPDTTLVVYMGLTNLDIICRKLIEHGLSPDTPAAAIEQGTTAKQRVIPATLKDLYEVAKKADLQPPTLAIIGRVAALADDLAWFDPKTGEDQDDSQAIFTQLSYLSR